MTSRLRKAFHTLRKRIDLLKYVEMIAAVIEIQRYWRRWICRHSLRIKVSKIAVLIIQKHVRGKLVRLQIPVKRHKILQKNSVLFIEKAYMKYRWRRIRKNIEIFKLQ